MLNRFALAAAAAAVAVVAMPVASEAGTRAKAVHAAPAAHARPACALTKMFERTRAHMHRAVSHVSRPARPARVHHVRAPRKHR